MELLKARIVAPKAEPTTHKGVHIKVVLTNTSTKDLRVLTWNTPLDDIITDCLVVTVNGKKIPYDGPMVKRAAPAASDYVVIKAGDSMEAGFDVSEAYDTTKPGTYEVKLKTPIPDVVPKVAKSEAMFKMATHAMTPVTISHKLSFKMAKGEAPRITLGAKARRSEAVLNKSMKTRESGGAEKKKHGAHKQGCLPALTIGGTAVKKAAALKAHEEGYGLCVAALAGLANDARYKEWFGKHAAARFKKVKANYAEVKRRMESFTFTYNLSSSGCGSGVFAYTYKDTRTIWFCDAFWNASATGTDSKAGTVLHEHTHSDALTDDHVYGQDRCRQFAKTHPAKAILNADTHEYYAGG